MDKRSLFSAMRPSGPMKGGERLVVPKSGPGTRKGCWEMAWGWMASWENSLSCPCHLHPTFLLFERDTSFTGSAGSVTLSPNPQHQFSLLTPLPLRGSCHVAQLPGSGNSLPEVEPAGHFGFCELCLPRRC
ncbi:unnamed protein product [Rangifer tarandus platyrhynchus]|uniref:Uncharacterized protein n=1 Tax=Rangifer tarandus platyrhynchus TaxID=3082113 RepID=A0ABN8XWR6_RANTA|nr:unnamed protein product [Rangifer tarandus platyrhynchus]